ncbi:hypothetical protein GSI_07889 [Ganoderma sinense ZZ0214-1]|uniref:Uncharacterized protein n=1 Tax=Ganoderma sinense ZZ0214-1 TaxID=1077348 RepID=A0A2G8S8X0_9APHY|nr:hypothetical protein GSI_07889 [Ganoderma sinense ZZ0214-1]
MSISYHLTLDDSVMLLILPPVLKGSRDMGSERSAREAKGSRSQFFSGFWPAASSSDPPTSSEPSTPRDALAEATTRIAAACAASSHADLGELNGYVTKAVDKYTAISESASQLRDVASPLLSPIIQGVIDTEPVKEISNKISAIVDGIPALLGVLDTVAKIHPFIGVAVGAFKVAVELDLKRRDNEKKISSLFATMRDTMAVLAQLETINGHNRTGSDNATIAERMKDVIQKTAEDIKSCADYCKEYAEKSLASKMVLSGPWSDNLEKYKKLFIARRDDFVFALALHTGQAINAANAKLDNLTTLSENIARSQEESNTRQVQLAEEVKSTMRDESNRIIAEAIYGPHQISDPIIHEIWKKMRWSGSVKGRDFVAALRTHLPRFQGPNVPRDSETLAPTSTSGLSLSDQDAWTLKYIDAKRTQAIVEAFDEEAASSASSYVSVEQVNVFIASPRADGWSILHWLAYWAVGRQMIMSRYAEEIDTLLAKMFALKRDVLPANRNGVDQYLHHVWTCGTTLTAAFRRMPTTGDQELPSLDRFQSYTQDCQERLRENLETAKYNIDGESALGRICGPGPIEKHVFPLLYLLLKRDFEIMRLARKECLHVHELEDSMRAILVVFTAVRKRYEHLAESFKQQGLEPVLQFRVFAFEMFKYMDDQEKLSKLDFPSIAYEETAEDQHIDPANIAKYPLQMVDELFVKQSAGETGVDMHADPVVRKILGYWSGFCGDRSLYPSQSMFSLDLHVAPDDWKHFQGTGTAADGTNWNLTGEYAVLKSSKRTVSYTFTITYAAHYPAQHFSAELDRNGTTLSGSWGYRDKPFPFMFKRLSPEVMRFYPTPAELAANKPRALWQFAIRAILDQLARKRGSWRWLKKRWETGQRYAKLTMRRDESDSGTSNVKLTAEEVVELAGCQRAMTTDEARLFNIFIDLCKRSVPVHWHVDNPSTLTVFAELTAHCYTKSRDVECKSCGEHPIRGSRILCITCGLVDSVSLCSRKRCLTAVVPPDVHHHCALPHNPSHDILKLPVAIHPILECADVYRKARSAAKTVRQLFAELQPSQARRAPQCVHCRKPVSLPCWYCIECEGDVFVCVSCDTKHDGVTVRTHKDSHALVRCQPLVDAEPEHAAGEIHVRAIPLEKVTPPDRDEEQQHMDSFFLHPVKAARAVGAKIIASVQECVHA